MTLSVLRWSGPDSALRRHLIAGAPTSRAGLQPCAPFAPVLSILPPPSLRQSSRSAPGCLSKAPDTITKTCRFRLRRNLTTLRSPC
jgi:hypothetical protein